MKSLGILLKNEWNLNIRNRNMVIFAVMMPLVASGLPGFIYGTEPAAEGAAFLGLPMEHVLLPVSVIREWLTEVVS